MDAAEHDKNAPFFKGERIMLLALFPDRCSDRCKKLLMGDMGRVRRCVRIDGLISDAIWGIDVDWDRGCHASLILPFDVATPDFSSDDR